MTIEEYLRGSFDFQFSDANLASVLASRGIDATSEIHDVSEKDRDLAKADLYIILSNVVSGGGRRVTKGNRSVSERVYQFGVYDRRNFVNQANLLYAKWGEKKVTSSVKFVKFYGN